MIPHAREFFFSHRAAMGGATFIGRVRELRAGDGRMQAHSERQSGGARCCACVPGCQAGLSGGAMACFEARAQVVSNRMQKTVVVACSYVIWVPKYKVYEKRVARHMVRSAVVGGAATDRRPLNSHRSCQPAALRERADDGGGADDAGAGARREAGVRGGRPGQDPGLQVRPRAAASACQDRPASAPCSCQKILSCNSLIHWRARGATLLLATPAPMYVCGAGS